MPGDIAIEVYRGAGDRAGAEVIDPLITSIDCAISRGKAELDETAHGAITTDLDLVEPRFDIEIGDVVEVSDAMQGESWRGLVVSVVHTFGTPPTRLTVERSL